MDTTQPFVANPILWADYPDPDVIRVGDWFYMVATSMHCFPGNPILRSRDLVQWGMVGYALPGAPSEDPGYALAGPGHDYHRYARGPWACSLRHHQGVFYVACISLTDQCTLISRATDPAGPWTVNRIEALLYDPSLLFDDRRVFIVHNENRPGVEHAVLMTELTADLSAVVPDSTRVLYRPPFYLEGAHAYRIDGRYYVLLNTAGKAASSQWCLRADHRDGPWEVRCLLDDDGHVPGLAGMTLHQACLIQDGGGSWWSVIFQDVGSAGRAPHLQPVTWTEGWPMIGHRGVGLAVVRRPTPLPGAPAEAVGTSDTFDQPHLGLAWQWNHLPDPAGWSLAERPGWLRLRSTRVQTDLGEDLQRVRNLLTQRLQGPATTVTAWCDVSGLRAGDRAGLAVFHKPWGWIGVRVELDGRRRLVVVLDGALVAEAPVTVPDRCCFRVQVDAVRHEASFSWSLDGRVFVPLGSRLDLQFNLRHFVGNRVGVFHQATSSLGGWFDVDGVHVTVVERPVPPAQRILVTEALGWSGAALVRIPAEEGGGRAVRLLPGDQLTLPSPGPGPATAWIAAEPGAHLTIVGGEAIAVPGFGPGAWTAVTIPVPPGPTLTLGAAAGAVQVAWVQPAK